jgi:hypothetical protein
MAFPEAEYAEKGLGLCWLVRDKVRGFRWGPDELPVVYVPDTKEEKSYKRGARHFESILLAPILRWGTGELVGVVCLDSEKPNHYGKNDKWLIGLVAMSIASAWAARERPSVAGG